jgi:outer membrane protein assembly factor BamB
LGSGKLGIVYGFDPETGERLWETWIGIHQNDWLEELPMGEVVEVYPGVWGGVETPMAAADGVVYALTLNLMTPYTATGWDAEDGTEAVARAEGTQFSEKVGRSSMPSMSTMAKFFGRSILTSRLSAV